MRKTKIICTIGPACDNEVTLTKMCQKGMNVARLNFSHGDHEEQQRKIDMIKQIRKELKPPVSGFFAPTPNAPVQGILQGNKLILRCANSFTQERPMGLGRKGERVAKTPRRVLPPNRGGRTVGDQS